jgi:hypothetical protein
MLLCSEFLFCFNIKSAWMFDTFCPGIYISMDVKTPLISNKHKGIDYSDGLPFNNHTFYTREKSCAFRSMHILKYDFKFC